MIRQVAGEKADSLIAALAVDDATVAAFASETTAIVKVIENFVNDPRSRDEIPDLLSIHLSTLQNIRAQFGSRNPVYTAALQVSVFVSQFAVESIRTAYDNQMFSAVVGVSLAEASQAHFYGDESTLNLVGAVSTFELRAITPSAAAVPGQLSSIQVQRYQIVLWFSIIFALIMIAAAWSLAFMSFKKDPIIFSTVSPNWENKRR